MDLGLALGQLRRRSGLTLLVEVALSLAERAAELGVVAALVVKVDQVGDWRELDTNYQKEIIIKM